MLWTRVTPAPDLGSRPLVEWTLARDPGLREPVARGSLSTGPERDFTVKVDAVGLEPGSTYYYRFESGGEGSPIGRTRTLPAGATERLRLAVASCSNLPYGYFNAYAAIARRADLDAVLHLGDYLYEYANGTYGDGRSLGRVPEPDREIVTLADYRQRHAQYKRDPDSRELHRQHPVIAVWDDHESANNAWRDGAQNHQPEEGSWQARRRAATRAYLEWMPIREIPIDPSGRIYRSFRFGDLADLLMLDTRLVGRDPQLRREDRAGLADPGRSLLGAAQEAWLLEELEASKRAGIAWRLLGQQVMMGQLVVVEKGLVRNTDQWDGYPASRTRLLDHLEERGIADMVVLTGDVHSSWAIELTRDPFAREAYDARTGRGALAVEMVTPAVTSPAILDPDEAARRAQQALDSHPHIRWLELHHRGYLVLDVDHERAQGDWFFVDTIRERRADEIFGNGFAVARGSAHLERVRYPADARPGAPEPAP